MVTSTKFASLVGSVTLAFVLASSLHPVHTAPIVRRQDAAATTAAAPAGYVSVAQPSMSEQDIYAVGIPPSPPAPMSEQDIYAAGIPAAPAADPASQLEQVLQAATQAALTTSNNTWNVVNHYDATPPTGLASPEQVSQVGTTEPVQMTGNPGEGDLFKQAAGVPVQQQEASDAYQSVIAQQMEQLGSKARRGLEDLVAGMGRRQLGLGVPTPLSETGAVSAAVPEATEIAAAATDAVASAAAPVATGATAATAATADVPVAAPVPSDFSSPPVAAAAEPAVPSVPAAAPAVPSASAPDAPLSSDLPTSEVPEASTSVAPAALPSAAVPSAPAVSIPAVLPSLNAAAASATTLLPSSDSSPAPLKTASPSASDVTMTVTLPTKALPTSVAGLPNVKANNAADSTDDDGEGDWKTMTILVPAEAFGSAGGVRTQVPLPASSGSVSASADVESASSTASPASAKVTATPTEAPINLSSFTSMKAAATGVLTIPLTGVIDGTTYSTMLTLTIPRFGGPASSSAPALTTSVSVSATEKANSAAVTSSPATKTSSPSSSPSSKAPVPTSSIDPSFIPSDDIPPLLKGSSTSSTASPTSTPSTPDNQDNGDDQDCEEEDEDTDGIVGPQSAPKSLLTQVWDWVTGKPLNERDWDDDYGYDYEDGEVEDGEWYDAQE